MSNKSIQVEVPESCSGMRVDQTLAQLFPDHSRSTLQKWLRQGLVVVDDEVPRQRDRVSGGEQVELAIPEVSAGVFAPEPMPLDLVHEDQQLLVVNKPAGLVVHPGAGNWSGTLMNGLLHYAPELEGLPRAGIVHRLDKDTSGLLMVARTEASRLELIRQLAAREVTRSYLAVVTGSMVAGGSVDEPIGRDPRDRRRMRVLARGKPAVTHFRVEQRFRAHTLLRCNLETGRTHQIRVHLRHLGFPLVGDPVYGGRLQIHAKASDSARDHLRRFRRQALHAAELSLQHPGDGQVHRWRQDIPADMAALCQALEQDAGEHGC